ncbi:MAG: 3'(2'),5'-bisphosphate nucleotidase CysQ [Gemmataceae bacterium]|nr:3'(2'),5'-bisphosphate nucleotidase CysQ [Gemmataceae bacterium]
MNFARELEVALAAAARAGDYLQSAYSDFKAIPNAPASISTEADRNSQELILTAIASAFPDDALCGEEGTPTLQAAKHSGERIWVVDPIDGTRGFVMKNGEFSVMIGLVVAGKVVVGVVLEPAFSRTTFAKLGGGCWVQVGNEERQRCQVTETTSLMESVLVQSHAKKGDTPWPVVAMKPKRIVETYSAGVKLAMVARGDVDAYVNTYANFSDWDICAGDILVTEAGGQATGISGNPLRYGTPGNSQRDGLLATNGRLHALAVEALNNPRT